MSPIESRRYNECSGCCFINNLKSLRTANDLVALELGLRSTLLKSCSVILTFMLCVSHAFCYFVFLRGRWMAKRGIESVRCKKCVRVIVVENKFDISTLVLEIFLSIIWNLIVQLAGADLVTSVHVCFRNKNCEGAAHKQR